jgi:hypothetical protein
MNIRVECHSRNKDDERPVKLWLADGVLFVESIVDQWFKTNARYFRVRADDGNTYLLRHDEEKDQWALESFRSEHQRIVDTDSDAPSEAS